MRALMERLIAAEQLQNNFQDGYARRAINRSFNLERRYAAAEIKRAF
jgi:hypothetical protein